MKHKFALGVLSGASALAVAVPMLAQMSSAATSSASSTDGTAVTSFPPAPVFTQERVQEMIAHDDAFLKNADALVAILKSATQAHRDALAVAVTLTDETARRDAVKKAHEDFRAALQQEMEANPDLKNAMPFGGPGFGGPMMGMMKMHHRRGPGGGMFMTKLSEKLGMTEEELKAAIDSGKTIEQIAEEKGVTLPERPMMRWGHPPMMDGTAPAPSSAAQQ